MRRRIKGPKGKIGNFVLFILLLLIFGSFVLTGGLLPSFQKTSNDSSGVGELILITDVPGGSESSLQLKTLKFKQCTSKMALNFLLDRSSSMNQAGKIQALKTGFINFTNGLSDDSVIGVQDFSSSMHPRGTVAVLIPFSYYKDAKTTITSSVQSLTAYGNTSMKTALLFSRDRLKEGIAQFPQYNFVFLFLSDGVPVPSETETPSQADIDSLKALKIRIFTVAYGTSAKGVVPLMKQIASSPNDAYYAPDPEEISNILNQISIKFCTNP